MDRWHEVSEARFQTLYANFQNAEFSGGNNVQFTASLDSQQMNVFYESTGPAMGYLSHSACFSYLRELPEHPLPCGHVLCAPCVAAYGSKTTADRITMNLCPLHVSDTKWLDLCHIMNKPPWAGVST